ncbi:DUF4809 family protein [Vagococcus sp.]|uniref:DUF4809 family protein n=1 Tax=Vagococcus sp. TaxID=1933889 RepID=UPI003F96169A
MKKVNVYEAKELMNGGCNACPTVETAFYHVEINGIRRPLEQLDVMSLITALSLAEGYEQHQEYDVMEDYDVFKKGPQSISIHEVLNEWEFVSGTKHKKVFKSYPTPAELFIIVNELLVDYFELDPKEFILLVE